MRFAFGFGILACAVAGTSQAQSFAKYPVAIRPLLDREAKLNNACKGEGDNPATQSACDRRDAADKQLNKLGWCWGPDAAIEADKRWMRCGPNASPES